MVRFSMRSRIWYDQWCLLTRQCVGWHDGSWNNRNQWTPSTFLYRFRYACVLSLYLNNSKSFRRSYCVYVFLSIAVQRYSSEYSLKHSCNYHQQLLTTLTVILAAFLTLCFVLLHVFWGVIFYDGLDKKKNRQYIYPAVAILTHLLVSCVVSFRWCMTGVV